MKNVTQKKLSFSLVLSLGFFIILSFHADVFASSSARPLSPAMGQSSCGDIEVVPTPSAALYGDVIKVYINISSNQCQMSAFGFDLFYETSMFSYQGIEIQNCLTSDWSLVDADEVSPGQVRIGGFAGSGSTIEATDNGCLVVVNLEVICQCPDCTDGQQSAITIDDYADELASYNPSSAQGTFTLICCCGDISIPSGKSGAWGDIVNIPVNIANNGSQICNFSFDFVFDPAVFDVKQTVKVSLIQSWTTLNWSQVSPGKIHINGSAGSGSCIPPMRSGSLVTIRMAVKCAGYATDTSVPIRVEAFQGGISCLCPRSFETDFLYRACPRLGDTNGDGNLTPGDAQAAFEIYLGKLTPTLNQLTVSDANCSCPCSSQEHTAQNNCTTPGDAQWIFEHYLGRRTLPLCCANYQCQTGSVKIQKEQDLGSIPVYENPEIYILPAVAHSGERLTVPVMVDNPGRIHYFGLELFYPQDLLEYEGLFASPLTQRFDYVTGEEEYPGVIKIEGEGEAGIVGEESGSLCVVVFRVREEIIGSAPFMLNSLSGEICRSDPDSMVYVRPKPSEDETTNVSLGKGFEQGGMFIVPLKVTDAFGLKAFGTEVQYSADKMTFVGVRRTDLTKNFVAVDGNEIEEGLLRIGGYGISGIKNSDGVLVELIFQVKEAGGGLEITNSFDGLKGSHQNVYPRSHPKK
jgi:hypothetical protein